MNTCCSGGSSKCGFQLPRDEADEAEEAAVIPARLASRTASSFSLAIVEVVVPWDQSLQRNQSFVSSLKNFIWLSAWSPTKPSQSGPNDFPLSPAALEVGLVGLAWAEARDHERGSKTRGASSGLFPQQLLGTKPAFGFNLPASFLAPFAITGARAGPKAVSPGDSISPLEASSGQNRGTAGQRPRNTGFQWGPPLGQKFPITSWLLASC